MLADIPRKTIQRYREVKTAHHWQEATLLHHITVSMHTSLGMFTQRDEKRKEQP